MSRFEVPSPQQFSDYNAQLVRSLGASSTDDFFSQINLPPDWVQLHNNCEGMRVIAAGHNLVAKIFTPFLIPYATALFNTVKEQSSLELTRPVLKPLAHIGQSIFFQQGEVVAEPCLRDVCTPDEIELMGQVAKKNGLQPLGDFSHIVVVRIDGKEYLCDSVDDNANSVVDYLQQKKLLNY